MNELVYFILAIIPAVLWIWFFRRRDRSEPEPVRLLIISALVGALVVIPAAYLEIFIIQTMLPDLFSFLGINYSYIAYFLIIGLLVVAAVEEIFKFLAVRLSVYYSEYFNEFSDGIIYMVSAAFGFAAFENFLYFLHFGNEVIFARSLLTPLFHASASAIVGHYLGLYKFEKKIKKKIFYAIIFAIIIHFFYNFLVFSASISGNLLYMVLAIGLLTLSAKWMFDKFWQAEEKDAKCWFRESKIKQ